MSSSPNPIWPGMTPPPKRYLLCLRQQRHLDLLADPTWRGIIPRNPRLPALMECASKGMARSTRSSSDATGALRGATVSRSCHVLAGTAGALYQCEEAPRTFLLA